MTCFMFFAGLQKSSLIDYPGKMSCVCFVSGCNFRCPYCYNPILVTGDQSKWSPIDDQSFYDFLERRKGFLDGVVISGGEPTLRDDLQEICATIKGMGYAVKLDTNGSNPLMIRRLIQEKLLDYVAMDIKTDPRDYPLYIAKGFDPTLLYSSIGIIMDLAPEYEFRTTCVRPLVEERTIDEISRIIEGAKLYALQSFHRAKILDPDFFAGVEPGYSSEKMLLFKSIARPRVRTCTIR